MRILSIQSSVAFGYVGNSAAVFALQRLGHEVWPVDTVTLANHVGYETARGRAVPASEIAELVTGLDERGALGDVDAVLTGYLGGADQVAVVLDAVERARAGNPALTYGCDPVLGDGHALYVSESLAAEVRDRLVPTADIVTPNAFELGWLTGAAVDTLDDVVEAAGALLEQGPERVLVTSVPIDDGLGMVALDASGAWATGTPRLPIAVNGAGDIAAALFLAHLHETGTTASALACTTAAVYGVLEATRAAGTRELRLVEAQQAIVRPANRFEAHRLR